MVGNVERTYETLLPASAVSVGSSLLPYRGAFKITWQTVTWRMTLLAALPISSELARSQVTYNVVVLKHADTSWCSRLFKAFDCQLGRKICYTEEGILAKFELVIPNESHRFFIALYFYHLYFIPANAKISDRYVTTLSKVGPCAIRGYCDTFCFLLPRTFTILSSWLINFMNPASLSFQF